MLISQGWWGNQVRDGCQCPAGWQHTAAGPHMPKPPGRTFTEGLLRRGVGGWKRRTTERHFLVRKQIQEGSVNVTRDGNVCRNPQILEMIKTKWGEVYTRPSGPLEEMGNVSLVQGSQHGLFWGQTLGRTHRPSCLAPAGCLVLRKAQRQTFSERRNHRRPSTVVPHLMQYSLQPTQPPEPSME